MLPHRSGRYRTQLLKFTGEFVIIFSSITFTWWFDEWRQERNNRKDELSLLINLNANLSLDSAKLTSELNYILKSEYIFDDFLGKLESENLKDSDSSGFLLRRLIISPEFHPNKATFEAIKSTGELKLIQDDSLTQSIMNLYEVTYQELDFLIDIYNRTSYQTIWDYAIENFDLRKVLSSPENLIFQLNFQSGDDKKILINKIMFTKMAVNFSIFRMEQSLEKINQLKVRIRNRINILK